MCSSMRSEKLVREAFEDLLGVAFPKARPGFLGRLELDGYAETLQLAFEFQGKQHFERVPFFDRNDGLEGRMDRDRRKLALCKQEGVDLIIIPYTHIPKLCSDAVREVVNEILQAKGYLRLTTRKPLSSACS